MPPTQTAAEDIAPPAITQAAASVTDKGTSAGDIAPPSVPDTEHRTLNAEHFLRITVEDHGTGIAPEVRERIFEPFFTTKDKSVGAGSIGKGLGLFVSYAIVQEHGRALSVESDPGNWTRFQVDLPVDSGWELEAADEE